MGNFAAQRITLLGTRTEDNVCGKGWILLLSCLLVNYIIVNKILYVKKKENECARKTLFTHAIIGATASESAQTEEVSKNRKTC